MAINWPLYDTKIKTGQKSGLSRDQGRKSERNLIRFLEVVEQGKEDSRGFNQKFRFCSQVKGGRRQASPDESAKPVGRCLMDVAALFYGRISFRSFHTPINGESDSLLFREALALRGS
jgi:hypothetical protein